MDIQTYLLIGQNFVNIMITELSERRIDLHPSFLHLRGTEPPWLRSEEDVEVFVCVCAAGAKRHCRVSEIPEQYCCRPMNCISVYFKNQRRYI